MLDCRRIEGRIVEDIERRPCLRGARIDVPRNMTWKDVWSIEGYPTPYCKEQDTCQKGISAIDTGRELHCRWIEALVGGEAAEDGGGAIS